MKRYTSFLLFCLLTIGSLAAQTLSINSEAAKIKVSLDAPEDLKVGDKVYLIFEVEPKEEWHVYSAEPSEEGAYNPAEIGFDITSAGFEANEKTEEEGPMISEMDDIMGGVVRYYKRPVIFKKELTITDPEIVITGWFDYMGCNEFKCVPFSAEFKLQAQAEE